MLYEFERSKPSLRDRIIGQLIRWRRRFIPYLVWWNDELDIVITLSENKLQAQSIPDAKKEFLRGSFYEAEGHLNECGITFDTGMGPDGRDWEWDWSLHGPISVKFRGRASEPNTRC